MQSNRFHECHHYHDFEKANPEDAHAHLKSFLNDLLEEVLIEHVFPYLDVRTIHILQSTGRVFNDLIRKHDRVVYSRILYQTLRNRNIFRDGPNSNDRERITKLEEELSLLIENHDEHLRDDPHPFRSLFKEFMTQPFLHSTLHSSDWYEEFFRMGGTVT